MKFLLWLILSLNFMSFREANECYLCDNCSSPNLKKTDLILCKPNQACLKAVIHFSNESVTFRACKNIDPLSRLVVTGHDHLPIMESHFYYCTSQLCNGSMLNHFNYLGIHLALVANIIGLNYLQ